ncbi:unnamed protein product [Blepharisma stoltei]|uniref:Dickkopf N-terminal cysteine-rich domain-containing protein n=1 Tax=Blepharisma stoltei TaxID=1481888 RepID=A0AAU9J3M2_9CILI|nr:unnamed protein product [Blepharisma stoltei]
MKLLILASFAISLAFSEISVSKTCTQYLCKPDSIDFPSESTCLYFENFTYYSRSCDNSEYYCDASTVSDTHYGYCVHVNDTHIPHTFLPGEDCHFDDDCFEENSCIDGKCKGLEKNENCTYHEECDVGLYCNETCKSQIALGRVGCFNDYQCSNTGGCVVNSLTDSSLNVCVPYFTMRNYTVDLGCSDSGGINLICDSGFCLNNAGKSMCYPIPTSSASIPVECSSNSQCVSQAFGNDKLVFTQQCTCGYNSNGQSYCPLFLGDSLWKRYFKILKKWIDSDQSLNCNTASRNSYNCMKNYWNQDDLDELAYFEAYASNYPIIYSIESCTMNVFFPSIEDIINNYNNMDSGVEKIVTFIILGFI